MTKLIDCGPSPRGAHRLELMLTCPQLYAYKFVLGLDLAKSGPLVRGSIGHVGLAHYYARKRAIEQGTPIEEYLAPFEAVRRAANDFGDAGIEWAGSVSEAVSEYQRYWTRESGTVYAVEAPAELNVEGHRYTARVDLVLQDPKGKLWIVDHKFVSKLETKSVDRYTLSLQFLGLQTIGRTILKERFGGIWLNFIEMKPLNPPRFKRLGLDPAPMMLRRFPRIVADAETRIAELTASGRDGWDWPRTACEKVCLHSYGKCDGFELCRWGPAALGQTAASELREKSL